MEHHLVTAAVRILGNFRGTRMIRENRESQRIAQRENGIDGGRITANVVQNDGEARASDSGGRSMRDRASLRGPTRMEKRLQRGFNLATTHE
jgi:hypothetical protein